MTRAYSIIEDVSGDSSGTIVFTNTNLEARKIGANRFTDGELGGLRVFREPSLDQYADEGRVPIEVMVEMGWWTTCYECGRDLNSETYAKEYYADGEQVPEWPPIGYFDARCFCEQACKDEYEKQEKLNQKIIEGEIQILRAKVYKHFRNPIFFGDPEVRVIRGTLSYSKLLFGFSGFDPQRVWCSIEYNKNNTKPDSDGVVRHNIYTSSDDALDYAIEHAKQWMKTQLEFERKQRDKRRNG